MNTLQKNHSAASPERLFRLTDGIYAISMVIFIVTGMLTVQDGKFLIAIESDPMKFLTDRAYEFLLSFLVFLFLALYWYNNVRITKYLVKVDSTYLWINIFYLFFIAVAPFPNAMSITHGNLLHVQLFFGIVMFFIGFLSFCSWVYASKNHRLINHDISRDDITALTLELLVEPTVALISIMASLISTAWWEPSLLLLPVGIVIVSLIKKRQGKKSS